MPDDIPDMEPPRKPLRVPMKPIGKAQQYTENFLGKTSGQKALEIAERDARSNPVRLPPRRPVAAQAVHTRSKTTQAVRVLAEASRRVSEALRLWEPLPKQQLFHASRQHIRLLVGGNRSGKTTTGCVEIARAILGCDPFNKYWKRNGTAVIVSKDEDTISSTTYPTLFQPGAFKIIRDEFSGMLRAVRPWQEYDQAYKEKWRDAPPLIPERLCDRVSDIAWDEKKRHILNEAAIPSTGWKLLVYSGMSIPKVGFKANLFNVDEECTEETWFGELDMRTVDRKGVGFVTATPEKGSSWLYDLACRAEDNDPEVGMWQLDSLENAHIDAEDFKLRQKSINSAELRDTKRFGTFRITSGRVFTEYSDEMHLVDWFDIPAHWTLYLSIDAAVNPCTVEFLAVPPPEDPLGRFRFIFDEFQGAPVGADDLAKELAARGVGTQNRYERFFIDIRYAQRSEMATGRKAIDAYREAFRRHGVVSERQGADFTFGITASRGALNIRAEAIKDWMRGESPEDRVLKILKTQDGTGTMAPVLLNNFRRCVYKRGPGGVVTSEILRKHNDALDCLGYMAHAKVHYVPKSTSFSHSLMNALKRARKAALSAINRGGISLGPDFPFRPGE